MRYLPFLFLANCIYDYTDMQRAINETRAKTQLEDVKRFDKQSCINSICTWVNCKDIKKQINDYCEESYK